MVLIAAVLFGIALPPTVAWRERQAAASARDEYVWAAAVARGLAIERGATVRLELVDDGSAALVRIGADTVQRVDFRERYGATAHGDPVTICYSARGYATPTGCSQNIPAEIEFRRGEYAAAARVGSLGSVEAR